MQNKMLSDLDWIAVSVFSTFFYVGVMSTLSGGFLGPLIIYLAYKQWTRFENWRLTK